MKIKNAIILGAGFGKRMRPITNKIPKPLVKINEVSLLENSIKFLTNLGFKHIVINAHYMHKEISNFIKKKNFLPKIEIVIERKKILNTGGGILNASKKFKKKSFLVLNPDTLWGKNYKKDFKNLENEYFKSKKSTMLLVKKIKSFDRSFKGDFNINFKKIILREKKNSYIFTGAQILNKNIFKNMRTAPFPINIVWDKLIKKEQLTGVISKQKFFHINTYKIYKKLRKKTIY